MALIDSVDRIDIFGYVTQDKLIARRAMSEIKAILGFRTGRLARGALFVRLSDLTKVGGLDARPTR